MYILLMSKGQIAATSKAEKEEIDMLLNDMPEIANPKEAKELISEILVDGFKEETKLKGRNLPLITKLNQLKAKTIDFYLQSFKDNERRHPELKYNCDIHTKIGEYLVQLIRYRMVIEPEIQLTTNVHRMTKITYLTVKGFWFNDYGIKERKFTRSLGRADEYPLGKDDDKAIEDATTKMQSILMEEYLKYYPDF
jgi:hypothetical protein